MKLKKYDLINLGSYHQYFIKESNVILFILYYKPILMSFYRIYSYTLWHPIIFCLWNTFCLANIITKKVYILHLLPSSPVPTFSIHAACIYLRYARNEYILCTVYRKKWENMFLPFKKMERYLFICVRLRVYVCVAEFFWIYTLLNLIKRFANKCWWIALKVENKINLPIENLTKKINKF